MSSPPAPNSERKVIHLTVLGDASVGKTALLRRFKGLPFEFTYKMTVGADFVVKRLQYENIDLTVQIYDVGGQPQFSHLRSRYYSNSQGAMIVFDLMRRETYENIPTWFDEILEKNDHRFIPLLLVGNKEDLAINQTTEISREEINEYVQVLRDWGHEYDPNFKIQYLETSAKTGLNVDQAFMTLIDLILDKPE